MMENFDDIHPQGSNSTGVVIVLLVVGLVSVLGGFFYLQSNREVGDDGPAYPNTPTPELSVVPSESSDETPMEITPLEVDDTVSSEEEDQNISDEATEINLVGINFKYSQSRIQAKVGELTRIIFSSEGGLHDLVVDELDISSDRISTGQSTVIEFIAQEPGQYSFYCSVSNHRSLGMEGVIVVTD